MRISDQTVSEKTLHLKRLVVKIQLSRYCKGLFISLGVWLFRVTDCMSEKNVLAIPGGSNSASFESETHDP